MTDQVSNNGARPLRPGVALDRRSFLGVAGASAGALALGAGVSAQPRRARPGGAKNLIMIIADGMSLGALSISDHARRRRFGVGSRWVEWINEPGARTALVDTTPATGLLTDSAASASAWSIGRRVNNGAISITPDGSEPEPMFVRAKRAGRRVGLVTTSYLTDASPAAMFCNAQSRSDRGVIARQMVERGLDIGVGGGARDFDIAEMERAGARVARTWRELRASLSETRDGQVFGLLADNALPYALDRDAGAPTMRDLASAALGALADAPDGYCLFIENEGVDESAHANDAAALTHEMLQVEDTLEYLIGHVASRDDTLLVATTDHSCGNPGFSSGGAEGDAQIDRLLAAKRSFEWIDERFDELPAGHRSAEALAGLVNTALGVRLDDAEVDAIRRKLDQGRVVPYRRADTRSGVLGSALANHLGVAFTGRVHTTDRVIATAMGPGAESLAPVCHHTDLHDLMAHSLGLAD